MAEEIVKSTHKVEVVRISTIEKHPNADSLEIVRVWGYTCLVRLGDFKVGDLAAYLVPDSLVDATRPEFTFLLDPNHPEKTKIRIKVKRLRGIMSQGLLIKAPEGAKEGDDIAVQLGVERYEPQVTVTMHSTATPGPDTPAPVPRYDVDAFERYGHIFTLGEEVIVTEKIDGSNARFVCWNDQMHVGSHERWVLDKPDDLWWRTLRTYPDLEAFCRANQGVVVFGEVYGHNKRKKFGRMHYGAKEGVPGLVVFDLWKDGTYMDADAARELGRALPWVPLLYRGSLDIEKIRPFISGLTTMPNATHAREGIVILSVKERWVKETGRAQLKLVSSEFLEKDA